MTTRINNRILKAGNNPQFYMNHITPSTHCKETLAKLYRLNENLGHQYGLYGHRGHTNNNTPHCLSNNVFEAAVSVLERLEADMNHLATVENQRAVRYRLSETENLFECVEKECIKLLDECIPYDA